MPRFPNPNDKKTHQPDPRNCLGQMLSHVKILFFQANQQKMVNFKQTCYLQTFLYIIRKKLINVWNHRRALCHNAMAHQRITKILLHETHQAKLLNEAMPGCHKAIDKLRSFALFHTRYERSGYHFPIAWSRKKMPLECRELIRSELEWCKEPTPNMKSHSNKILSPFPKYQSILPNNHLLT